MSAASPEPPPVTSSGQPRPAGRGIARWVLAGVLLAAVVLFYLLGLQRYFSWDYLRGQLDEWRVAVDRNLPVALLAFFAVYVAVTALSLPIASPLSLVAGVLFGRWVGTGVVLVAATLGATLAFLSSRYVLRDWVQGRFGGRLDALNRGIRRDGAFYLFTLRLVPAFPFFLINLGMGLTPMRTFTFAWVSLLGMLPGTFLYVNAGSVLGSIESPGQVLTPGVLLSLAVLGVVPLALRWLIGRRTGPASSETP